jgi:hypothetical protein
MVTKTQSSTLCPLCHAVVSQTIFESRNHAGRDVIFWDCARCRLIFLDHARQLTFAEEVNRYERHQNHDSSGYRSFLRKFLDPMMLRLQPDERGLDYGCGPNSVLSVMLNEFGWVMNYYDPHFFPKRELLRPAYDFVTLTEVVEHFRFPYQEWDYLDRILMKPGAKIGVMTSFWRDDTDFGVWSYPREQTHVSFYRHATCEWISAQWNWNILDLSDNVGIFQKQ